MRLKEDKSSWKASNVLRKIQPVLAEPKKMHRAKNTRKWCKGKEGRLHDPQLLVCERWVSLFTGQPFIHEEWRCADCGKRWYNYDI